MATVTELHYHPTTMVHRIPMKTIKLLFSTGKRWMRIALSSYAIALVKIWLIELSSQQIGNGATRCMAPDIISLALDHDY